MQATLSHYRILEQIGEGRQSPVYRAHDEGPLDRDVALKVLRSTLLAGEAQRAQLQSEAAALSKLKHPNIATVYEFGSDSGTYYIAEEYIEGLSLEELLITAPLTEKEVLRLGTQLCQGVAAAHERGMVHCDLKPANIRVTPDAWLKIIDFGIAKVLQKVSVEEETTVGWKADSPGGTRPYMAPEQVRNEKVDVRSDIWGIGCVLFEMATGLRPFRGTGKALEEAILGQPVPSVTNFNPRMPAALDTIIAKCLEKDRRKRYASAKQIEADLRRLPEKAAPPRTWYQRCFRWVAQHKVALAGLALVVLILIPTPQPRVPKPEVTTITPAAHDLYLQGTKLLERWDQAGHPDAAIALFQKALNSDPSFALGYSALAEAYWVKYRLEKDTRWMELAEANCRLAAERNSQLPAIYVTLARVHNGKGEHNLALQEIQRALKLEPTDPDALLGEGAVLASLGRLQEAEGRYKQAAAARPQHWGGWYELGVFYFRHRRFGDAATAFEEVLEITPDNAMAHATLGGMLQMLKRDAEAETHLKRSIELQGSYAAYTNLGALYYRERRWRESAEMTQKALAINAKDYSAWANLGMAYEWLGESQKADEAYGQELARAEEIAKIEPNNAEVQAQIGLLYARKRQKAKAVRHIEAALVREPDNPDLLSTSGEAYEYLGQREKAIELAVRAISKGWTLGQLESDPGYRRLLLDPRFKARVHDSKGSPAVQPN